MVIDCHVHICAFTPGHGKMSQHLLGTIPFRFMRWRLGVRGEDETSERDLEELLINLIQGTPQIDAVVLLAFDAVYTRDGVLDDSNTHLYVTNDYAIELCRRHPRSLLFGASVHPYRNDAVAELERCIKAGAVLLKWLPIVQNFNPADERCFPLYEALAHYKLPLLSHTGGENSLPNLDISVADPMLLEPALKRGVTVIGAHCGTKSAPGEYDYLPQWSYLAKEYEHFYGDTAALNLPTRDYAYRTILEDEEFRSKLLHGSDWPILPLPPARLGSAACMEMIADDNWLRRDVRIKERLGLASDRDYWLRAGRILLSSAARL
jgi:predicted TIM-barrel fold metal-dependent hydrolase